MSLQFKFPFVSKKTNPGLSQHSQRVSNRIGMRIDITVIRVPSFSTGNVICGTYYKYYSLPATTAGKQPNMLHNTANYQLLAEKHR